MNEAKHTPGEWAVRVPGGDSVPEIHAVDREGGASRLVAFCVRDFVIDAAANARLIAAAPDLLAACKACESELRDLSGPVVECPIADAARSAIKKVEGNP